MEISLFALMQMRALQQARLPNKAQAKAFFLNHQKLLILSAEEVEMELRASWSLALFDKLILALYAFGQEDVIFTVPYANNKIQSEGCVKIYERIFLPNTTQAIFHKFILPHARLHEGVEYKYSRLEKSRYADLSIHSDIAFHNMQQLMKQDMFGQMMHHSQEGMRRERKHNLDILFSCVAKFGGIDNLDEVYNAFFFQCDEALAKERLQNTMLEWGSLHHVLYGMCSGSDDYMCPLWNNEGSGFQFLCYVKSLLEKAKLYLN